MSKPAFVALGDIHLDHTIWKPVSAVTGDAFLGYEAFIAKAIELKVPAVIVGDLFDGTKPDSKLIEFHRKMMDICAAEKIPVYFIQGNHDRQPVPWASAVHEHPIWVGNGTPFKIGELTCVGLDYSLLDLIKEKIAAIPQCDVLFLHQALKQALPFEGAWNCDLDWLVDKPYPKLVVIADIHKEMNFTFGEGRKAYYTGPGHARDIDQRGPKSVLVVSDDLHARRAQIPFRSIEKFVIGDEVGLRALTEWLDSRDKSAKLPAFAWIAHTLDLVGTLPKPADYPHIIMRFDPVASIADATFEDISVDTSVESVSIEALLGKLIDKDADPEAFALALDIAKSAKLNINDSITHARDKAFAE